MEECDPIRRRKLASREAGGRRLNADFFMCALSASPSPSSASPSSISLSHSCTCHIRTVGLPAQHELSPHSVHIVALALFPLERHLFRCPALTHRDSCSLVACYCFSRTSPCSQPGTSCAETTLCPLLISTRRQTRKRRNRSHLLRRALALASRRHLEARGCA